MSIDKYLKHTKPNGECLEWTRCLNSDGYARAVIDGNLNGKVHREVARLYYDVDIEGKTILHKCDNPKCINPKHLIIGDMSENSKDRARKKRSHYNAHTASKVGEIKRMLLDGVSCIEISRITGVDPRRVSDIKSGRTYMHFSPD